MHNRYFSTHIKKKSDDCVRMYVIMWINLYKLFCSFRMLSASVQIVGLQGRILLHVYLLAMHALHVSRYVHLLLSPIHAVWTLELRLFAALPFLVVSQRRLKFIYSAAVGTCEPASVSRQRRWTAVTQRSRYGQREPRRPLLPRQAPDPRETYVFRWKWQNNNYRIKETSSI